MQRGKSEGRGHGAEMSGKGERGKEGTKIR
jgi:hypothetical protein